MKLAASPEEELFGPGTAVADRDPRLEIALELERESGYRWARWRTESGKATKLHLRDGPHLGCGLWATHDRDLVETTAGEFCRRCLAADAAKLADLRERRATAREIVEGAWWRRTRPHRRLRISPPTHAEFPGLSDQISTGRITPTFMVDEYERMVRGTFAPSPDETGIFVDVSAAYDYYVDSARAAFAMAFMVPARALREFNRSTRATAEAQERERDAKLRADVDIIAATLDPISTWAGNREQALDLQARAAARLLGVDTREVDRLTDEGRRELVEAAQERIGSYYHRAHSAWCTPSRGFDITGGFRDAPCPRFRAVAGCGDPEPAEDRGRLIVSRIVDGFLR